MQEQEIDQDQPIVTKDRIFFHQAIANKKRLLEKISQEAENKLQIPAQEIFQAFIQREKLGNTCINNGIAIPHAKLPYPFKTLMFCFSLEKPIRFDSLNDQEVNLVFAFIFSDTQPEENQKQLMGFAEKIKNKGLYKQLKMANNVDEFYTVIQTITQLNATSYPK